LSSDKVRGSKTYSQIIEEVGYVSASENKHVTVKLDRWYYNYMSRAKLSIYEGAYHLEELKSVEEKCVRADTSSKDAPDCPRHFTIICRPADLVELAKNILKLYENY
jgi:hypothetical protein